jgi:hypothetical protein
MWQIAIMSLQEWIIVLEIFLNVNSLMIITKHSVLHMQFFN